MNIPKTMKAISLTGPNTWQNIELPVPIPAKGQVLIKMAFSPINPSDLAFLTGNYGLKKAFPVVPGLEGSGEVIKSGGGFLANNLVGKRVACTAPATGNGTWAEYMVTDFTKCVKLNSEVNLQQGAMLFVNPLTALSFIKKAKKQKNDLIVFTAAGSALAQMVVNQAQIAGLPVLGIVRKTNMVSSLTKTGFKKVLSTDSDSFLEDLQKFTLNYKNVIFFDAIGGGALPYEILKTLPENSQMIIYGRLELAEADFQPQEILFRQSKIEGYWLSKEALKKSILEILLDVRKIQKMIKNGFETNINQVIKLSEINAGLKTYTENMSAGKVLIDLTS
jgi:NADPH:quinone reductase